MPTQVPEQLAALGVPVDTTPYSLSFEDTVSYLATKIINYDLIVATQAVPDIIPALELIAPEQRPPLIEHGGLVQEALRGPKHLTARYIGVCRSIRDAAASRMPGREHHAVSIPSMVDLTEFNPAARASVRSELGFRQDTLVFGLVGRLDRKKHIEVFIQSAAVINQIRPEARFVIVGGPDAFMPEYAEELQVLTEQLLIDHVLQFLGDRPDVPRLMSGLDALVWLSDGEGMPHVISEAGAAGLPVIATPDNGALEQLEHEVTGLFVPYRDVLATARAMLRLADDPDLRQRLGTALRNKVERCYSADAVTLQWQELFDEVLEEHAAQRALPTGKPQPASAAGTTEVPLSQSYGVRPEPMNKETT